MVRRDAGESTWPGTVGDFFWGGYAGAGLALPLALSLLPRTVRHRRGVRLAGAAATLAGGLCLRAAVVRGGEASALDPEAVLGE